MGGMGGVGDKTHRSSSPLKRPASELEEDSMVAANGDVDMVNGPEGSINGANMSSKRSNNSPPPASIATMGMQKDNTTATDDMDEDGDGLEFYEDAVPATAMPEDSNEKVATQNIDSKKVKASDVDAPPPPPPIDEQIRIVTSLVGQFASTELKEGTRAYVVSNKWVERVKAHGSGAKVSAEVAESAIGPVDNSDIIWEVLTDQNNQPFARLNPDAVDYITYFPQEAWDLVVSWYGLKEGQPPIVRTAVDTSLGGDSNIVFETHPVVFRIHRLWAASSPIPIDQLTKAQKPGPKIWVVSRNEKVKPFLERIKKATGVKSDCKVTIWTVPEILQKPNNNDSSAAPSRSNTPAPEQIDWSQMLIDANAFITLPIDPSGREKNDHKDPCADANYVGGNSKTMAMAGLSQDSRIVLDECVEGHVHLSTYVKKIKNGGKTAALSTTVKGASSALATTPSGRSSPAPAPAIRMSTRGRSTGKTLGCVGLSNLGNTCYMNSALQCIRSVEELTKYFLAGEANEELNTENPLGKAGEIAIVYNGLLREMYKEPVPSSVTPRQFKNTIGRYFPNFSGYGQQDSQEFLGLLLDALQEDLNRIKKKPYIEKPDSTDDMINNPAALKKMADEVWRITKARDDSVISDLFTGMYKSTLVCPDCDKVSITFDPFNTVTVQIPIATTWSHTVWFFPLNGKPFKIDVDIDKNGTFKTMKDFISVRTHVPVDRLFIAEDWKCRFYRYFQDNRSPSEDIQAGDNIYVFELDMAPTNWPPNKKQKKVRSMLYINDEEEEDVPEWDSPEAERMIVPLFFRRTLQRKYGNKAWGSTMVPQLITLTKEEARSEAVIRRKVLQRVQNLTTWQIKPDDEIPSRSDAGDESADQDMVVTTASDASSGDRNVAANSVDGDEELVDITMKDPTAPSSPESTDPQECKLPGQTPPPKWLDPSVPLNAYSNMFDITILEGGDKLIPYGNSIIHDDKDYLNINTRMRRREPEEVVEETVADDQVGSPISEEDSDVPQLGDSVTRMNDETSEEEDDLAAQKLGEMLMRPEQTLPLRTARQSFNVSNRHRVFKRGLKTYSRKKSTTKPPTISPHFGGDGSNDSSGDEVDLEQEPLVRLSEALVIDWSDNAIAALVDGIEGQGCFTMPGCPTLEDPQLMAKKAHRSRRRKDGVTLSECLDEFGKEEVLSEADMWYCNRCKEFRRATKKLELWKTPDILVLHFKRFSSMAHRRDKLDVRVDFPIEGLDMTKRIVESDGKEEVYDLFAVDNHYGSLGGGHYTACAKSFIDEEWYDYNDSSVSKIKDPQAFVQPAAYLLFYRRRSDKALGGPKFQDIIERMKTQDEAGEEETDLEDETGNGQRLGEDSPSQNGSSSASPGVGQTVPIPGLSGQRSGMLSPTTSPGVGRVGLGSLGGRQLGMGAGVGMQQMGVMRNNIPGGLNLGAAAKSSKVDTQHIENLPDYQEAIAQGAENAPNLGDAALNDGIQLEDNDADFEDDEAIDMGDAFTNHNFSPNGNLRSLYAPSNQSWGFGNIGLEPNTPNSVAGDAGEDSDDGIRDDLDSDALASDVPDNGSEASDRSRANRFEDFENADVDEDYREATPPPLLDESGAAGAVELFDLHEDIVRQKMERVGRQRQMPGAGEIGRYEDELELELEVPMAEGTEGKEKSPEAMDIHVEEGEGLGRL